MSKVRVALAAGIILSLLPAAARAGVLTLQVGPPDGTGSAESCLPGTHYVDLFLTETGPNEDEGLFAYDLGFDIVGPPVSVGNVRLTGASRPPTDFLMGDDPTKSTFTIAQGPGLTSDRRMVINVVGDTQSSDPLIDITSGKKAARVFYEVGPGTPVGQFNFVFDRNMTVFGSGDPNHSLEIDVDEVNPGPITVCPEPGGLAGLAGAAMLVLRRRRPKRA